MVEVYIDELKDQIDSLNSLIKQYEEVELNLFNNINNSCKDWQDTNSLIFEEKIALEKKESDLVLENIKEQNNVLTFIYDKYVALGKRIKFYAEKKESLLTAIDDCYSEATSVASSFDGVDKSFNYSQQSSIQSQKNKVVSVCNNLLSLKNDVKEIYAKISQIEVDIEEKISSLQQDKIIAFEFAEK